MRASVRFSLLLMTVLLIGLYEPARVTGAAGAEALDSSKLVFQGKDGKLIYAPVDAAGDIIPDFSNAGYMGGGVKIPEVPVTITLKPAATPQDDTDRIQQAIEQIAKLPLEKNGVRGAVLLTR